MVLAFIRHNKAPVQVIHHQRRTPVQDRGNRGHERGNHRRAHDTQHTHRHQLDDHGRIGPVIIFQPGRLIGGTENNNRRKSGHNPRPAVQHVVAEAEPQERMRCVLLIFRRINALAHKAAGCGQFNAVNQKPSKNQHPAEVWIPRGRIGNHAHRISAPVRNRHQLIAHGDQASAFLHRGKGEIDGSECCHHILNKVRGHHTPQSGADGIHENNPHKGHRADIAVDAEQRFENHAHCERHPSECNRRLEHAAVHRIKPAENFSRLAGVAHFEQLNLSNHPRPAPEAGKQHGGHHHTETGNKE